MIIRDNIGITSSLILLNYIVQNYSYRKLIQDAIKKVLSFRAIDS